jgi:hypothetical protein
LRRREGCEAAACGTKRKQERETGFEPATSSLGS